MSPVPKRPDRPATSARIALRAATSPAHERLDRLYSAFDLGAAEDYGAFLLAHAPAYFSVEAALEGAGAADIIPGWGERRRSGALRQDIVRLGLPLPAPAPPPSFLDQAQVLGGAYVLEGSRLGGAVLIRTVASSLPTAFLSPGNPADWRTFLSVLEERLNSPESLANAVLAAQAVFAMFEHSARPALEKKACDV